MYFTEEVRSLEKPQTKRKNSGLEDTISKRTKAISTTPNTGKIFCGNLYKITKTTNNQK